MPRPPLYPWDDWFATPGKGFTIEPGEDGVTRAAMRNMRAQVHGAANARGLRVTTRLDGDPFDDEGECRMVVKIVEPRATPARLDYDKLFNGEQHDLVQGVHFIGDPRQTLAKIQREARDRGIVVRSYTTGTTLGVRRRDDAPGLGAWLRALEGGPWMAGDLLDRARTELRDDSLSSQSIAAAMRLLGFRRQRTALGSVWYAP